MEPNEDTVFVNEISTPLSISSTDVDPIEVEQQTIESNKEEIKVEEKVSQFTEPIAITLEQAYSLYDQNVTFIDARDESDFLAGHITNATNIPFDDFDNHQEKLEQISKEKPLVIYCAGTDCDLSILLGNLLFEKGFKQVYVFFGGWIEWLDANYPVEQASDLR